MKFITVVDNNKVDEILEIGYLRNNFMFDMDEVGRKIISEVLSDLVAPSMFIVNGYCIDGTEGDLSNLWSTYLKSLPVKTGDIIMQYSVSEDECIFCDFNKFMEYSYLGDSEFIRDITSYNFDKDKVSFVQELPNKNFEKAFVVSDKWTSNDLVVSGVGSNSILTGISELKNINSSSVWR